MTILFYLNLICLTFNLVAGVGKAVLGTPGWWANLAIAAISGFCVWYTHRVREAT